MFRVLSTPNFKIIQENIDRLLGHTLIDIFPFSDEAVIIYNSLLPIGKKTKDTNSEYED